MRPLHFRKVGTGFSGHGRWPCATGLASYPSCYLCLSGGRPRFRDLPRFGSYRAAAVIAGLPAPSSRSAHSAMVRSLFTIRLRHRIDAAAVLFVRSKPPECGSTTLAHSSNGPVPAGPTVFAPGSKTSGSMGVTRIAVGLLDRATCCVRVANRSRSPPGFLVVFAGRNDPPRGSR